MPVTGDRSIVWRLLPAGFSLGFPVENLGMAGQEGKEAETLNLMKSLRRVVHRGLGIDKP